MSEENGKREYLEKIVEHYLETAKSLMEYYQFSADTTDGKLVCAKSIKEIEEAINHLPKIKHVEILEYLYSTFLGNNVIAYSVSGKIVNSQKLRKYDTKNGFKEFLEMVEEQKKEQLERERKRKESVEALKKAKEMGKKVEMVYDPKTKQTKPMIIEEKDNN